MKITWIEAESGGMFVAESRFEEKDILKKAGFLFHGTKMSCRFFPRCKLCTGEFFNRWWTKKTEAATRLPKDVLDQAAQDALQAHDTAVAESKATDSDIEVPVPAGLAYMPFQKAGIAYALARDSVLYGDEMGLGKTVQALGVINARTEIKNVLVVCPKSLSINWLREAERWIVDAQRRFEFHVVDEDAAIPKSANFIIVHYNRVTIVEKTAKCKACKGTGVTGFKCAAHGEAACERCRPPSKACDACEGRGKIALPPLNKSIVDSLMARTWDALIVDEAHYIKNPKAERTRAVLGSPMRKGGAGKPPVPATEGLAGRSKQKLFLTGTPILNKPIELHPLLRTIAPREFGDFMKFAMRYCDGHQEYAGRQLVWNFDGASNLEELQERLRATCMVRRLKKDVLTELPPKRRQIVRLGGDEEAVEREWAAWRSFEDEAEMAASDLALAKDSGNETEYIEAVKKLKYVERVAFMEMSAHRHAVAVSKIPAAIEHIETLLEGGTDKVVVFAHHNDVVEKVLAHFGTSAVGIYGKINDKDIRQAAVDRFQNDPAVKLFVGSIGAAAEGITLTAASVMVFIELDWTPARVCQAEDRIHRIGQKLSVLIQHLVVDGSLDAHMAEMLIAKQAIADKALDNDTGLDLPVLPVRAPKTYPAATPRERAAAKDAMVFLAQRCDGALQIDGNGFNKMDAHTGQRLATWNSAYTDGQVFLAKKLARRYRRQLPREIADALSAWVELPKEKKAVAS